MCVESTVVKYIARGLFLVSHWSKVNDANAEAGRVCLIGIDFSASLLRDQDRQLRGPWMSNRDGRWTTANSHARFTGKSRDGIQGVFVTWLWIHSCAAIHLEDKDTLSCWRCSRVWELCCARSRLYSDSRAVAGLLLWSRVLSSFLVSCKS